MSPPAIVPIDGSAREAVKLVPHARLIEYDGAPHGLLTTHKMEVTRDLLDFLRTEEVSASQESEQLQPAY